MMLKPLTFKESINFVKKHHRHSKPPRGHKFSIGLINALGELIGVAMVGRPVARMLDDGYTAEVTRLCTVGTQNACSMLYGACWRAAKAMGYHRILTYTLIDESGSSLHGAGWIKHAQVRGRDWGPAREGIRTPADKYQLTNKVRWVQGEW